MNELDKDIDDFVQKIKNTETYQNYIIQRNKVAAQPGLKEKIDEFRLRNFNLQNTADSEELYEKIDAFEEESEAFREDPMVDAFLSAELEFCRMLQEVYASISEKMDFD